MARKASLEVRTQWRRRLRRFARWKLSVAEFCRREKVSVASFYQWRKKLDASGEPGLDDPNTTQPTFLPVHVAATASLQVAFPNGATITLPVDDHQLIKLSIETIAVARTSTAPAASGEA